MDLFSPLIGKENCATFKFFSILCFVLGALTLFTLLISISLGLLSEYPKGFITTHTLLVFSYFVQYYMFRILNGMCVKSL